jgi:hypothetical protein
MESLLLAPAAQCAASQALTARADRVLPPAMGGVPLQKYELLTPRFRAVETSYSARIDVRVDLPDSKEVWAK